MRQLQKRRSGKKTRKTREPLAESIVPLTKSGKRRWSSMSDGELVAYAEKFMKENEISGKHELEKADQGLYNVLRRRKLLDEVGFERKRRKQRDWVSMSDEEIVAYAEKFMKEKVINERGELRKADIGLYEALRRRKLLDRIGFEGKRRPRGFFSKMSDDKLAAFAKKFMKENGINKRKELEKADKGLYSALWRRKLLDRVFRTIERTKQRQADDKVIRVLEEFGG